MLPATTIRRLDALGELSKQGKRINGLFRLMDNQVLWMQAYAKIHKNKGAMTKGVDGSTLDGFSDERVHNIIGLLKQGRYRFQPARRVYIPKANGKKRPLGIPSGDDKLVQEVVRNILERIYEPVFRNSSHGFRPRRSCHTALQRIREQWTSMKWIVDMDIKGCFDNIDHDILMRILEKRIDDKRFLKLIRSMLKAGYLEGWSYHATYSGTPQGGVVSPILANIYLHELDLFIDGLWAEFNTGKKRRDNPAYSRISWKIQRLLKKYDQLKATGAPEELEEIKKQIKECGSKRRPLPAGDPMDANYRRLTYCRYADDFVIGVIGSKAEAVQVMEKVKTFLQTELHFQISAEKSGIRHAREKTRFLGYDIAVYTGNKVVRTVRSNRHTTVKSVSERMQLNIPKEKLSGFCQRKGYGNYEALFPVNRKDLLRSSDADVVRTYNAEIRGFVNYYGLANMAKSRLARLYYLWWGSLIKTLARKHKTSVAKMAKKLKTASGGYRLTVRQGNKSYPLEFFRLKDFEPGLLRYREVDEQSNARQTASIQSELVSRLMERRCEYCGREKGYFEVHQVRNLKVVQNGDERWKQLMWRKQRKTLLLCIECHDRLHRGVLPEWNITQLKEAESRMR